MSRLVLSHKSRRDSHRTEVGKVLAPQTQGTKFRAPVPRCKASLSDLCLGLENGGRILGAHGPANLAKLVS